MADNMADSVVDMSDCLEEFLAFSDLQHFVAQFQRAGVSKFEHVQDIDDNDLKTFGKY